MTKTQREGRPSRTGLSKVDESIVEATLRLSGLFWRTATGSPNGPTWSSTRRVAASSSVSVRRCNVELREPIKVVPTEEFALSSARW